MKKTTSLLLALVMALAVSASAYASTDDTAGPPDLQVNTQIIPASLAVYQGELIEFKAITTFTPGDKEDQRLRFVSDSWAGTNNNIPAEETEPIQSVGPAADTSRRLQVFTAMASINAIDEPGEYSVRIIYTITLQHDLSGVRTYKTLTTSACFMLDVLEGKADAQLSLEEQAALDAQAAAAGQANTDVQAQEVQLNGGQIVSAWAHWKSSKASENILSGGAGVFRSLSWYKAQLDGMSFTSQQAVYDYLDSIYQPLSENAVDEAPKPAADKPGTIADDPGKGNPSDENANPNKDNPGDTPAKP